MRRKARSGPIRAAVGTTRVRRGNEPARAPDREDAAVDIRAACC